MNDSTKKGKGDPEYFDITKLFSVMDAKQWTEGKNFMEFWSKGDAMTAAVDPVKKKSTIGANLNGKLRIYTINWNWLTQFAIVNTMYKKFFLENAKNQVVTKLLKSKYGSTLKPVNKIIIPFNEWLIDGMMPSNYLQK